MRLHFEFSYTRIKVLADSYLANGRFLSRPIVGRSGYFEMDFFGKRKRVSQPSLLPSVEIIFGVIVSFKTLTLLLTPSWAREI